MTYVTDLKTAAGGNFRAMFCISSPDFNSAPQYVKHNTALSLLKVDMLELKLVHTSMYFVFKPKFQMQIKEDGVTTWASLGGYYIFWLTIALKIFPTPATKDHLAEAAMN